MQTLKDIYYLIRHFWDDDIRYHYLGVMRLRFTNLNWFIFGYLLIFFTKRKRFKLMFNQDYFQRGDIIMTFTDELIVLGNNNYVHLRRKTII